jgi:hypothetical protein
LDAVFSVRSDTAPIAELVTSSGVLISPAIIAGPVCLALTVAIQIFKGMGLTIIAFFRAWSRAANTNCVAFTLIDEIFAFITIVLPVALTNTFPIFSSVVYTEVAVV